MHDFRYALRQFSKFPGFTAVVIVTLALGIGANTAIFSVVDQVLLKSLPVKNPQELIVFHWNAGPQGWPVPADGSWDADGSCTSFSHLAFAQFRDDRQGLVDVFAFAPMRETTVSIDGEAEISSSSQLVSGGYFPGLGVAAMLGRAIVAADDRADAPSVGVISYRFWQRRFGGDPAIVGKTLLVNNAVVAIVGVAPQGFVGALGVGDAPDFFLPLADVARVWPKRAAEDTGPNALWWLRIMGRLKPHVSARQVNAALAGSFRESALESLRAAPGPAPAGGPAAYPIPKFELGPGEQGLAEVAHNFARELMILTGLVGLVLLIACANVANLLLARGAARRKEIAVRLALGASRGRLIRQLLTENSLFALAGGSLGLVVARWGADLLLALQPLLGEDGRPLVLSPQLDLRVLGYAAAAAVVTGILFGLVPALRASRVDLNAEIQGGARPLGGGSRSRLTRALMIVQVALSVVLLVGTGLFVRTLGNLHGVNVGFNREHLLLFRIESAPAGYSPARAAGLHDRIAERLSALPGVRAVSYSAMPLLSRAGWNGQILLRGRPSAAGPSGSAMRNAVGTDFFSALELPAVVGRMFTARDSVRANKVALVNQSMARQYFGEENPVGRSFSFRGQDAGTEVEIVGVVRDANYTDIRDGAPATIYQPFAQRPFSEANFFVRTAGDPAAATDSIRRAVRAIDPTLPLADVRTQDDQLERLFSRERLFAQLSACFGFLALALVCIGLYGLTSYAIARRTGEIGLRMALGARPSQVQRMVVQEFLLLVSVGVALGLGAAWAATRLVTNLLFGLSAIDPLTYGAVTLLLIAIATFACWLPARRAARIEPMTALHAE